MTGVLAAFAFAVAFAAVFEFTGLGFARIVIPVAPINAATKTVPIIINGIPLLFSGSFIVYFMGDAAIDSTLYYFTILKR